MERAKDVGRRGLRRSKDSIVIYIVGLFLLTRLLYVGLGTMGINIFKQGLPASTTAYPAVISTKTPVQMWYVWDSVHYANAAKGYDLSLQKLPVAGQKDGKKLYYLTHWFPIYPVSAKLLHTITRISIPYSLLIVSNAAFLGALYLLYKLVRQDENELFARLALAVFFLLPASFIFSAALSESMFLLLSVGALYAARRERWLVAGLLGFLVALTRSAGFLIALPLFIEATQQYGLNKKDWRLYIRPFAAATLTVLGLIAYIVYSWARTGDALSYVHGSYVGWNVIFSNPVTYVARNITQVRTFVVVAEIGVVLMFWRRVRWSHLAYTLVLAFAALSVGPSAAASNLRYMAPAFPIAIACVYLMQTRKGLFANYTWITLGIIQGVFFLLWVCWWQGFII